MEENNRLRELTNVAYSEARITGKVKMISANDYSTIIKKVKKIFSEETGTGGLKLIPQGYMPLYIQLTNYITSSLLFSFLGAFLMIGLVMLIFIRNFLLTIICLLVNLVPISFIIILLVVFNVPLDMGTVMIAAIMLGIAVDDTMHLVHAYIDNRSKGLDISSSIDLALKSTMSALMASSIALTLGFLVLGLSLVNSLQNFGNLCAAAVAITFIADILLFPSIIKLTWMRNPLGWDKPTATK